MTDRAPKGDASADAGAPAEARKARSAFARKRYGGQEGRASEGGRRGRPDCRARATQRSIAATLHPGAVLPGLGRLALRQPYRGAFAPLVLSRPALEWAAPHSWGGR